MSSKEVLFRKTRRSGSTRRTVESEPLTENPLARLSIGELHREGGTMKSIRVAMIVAVAVLLSIGASTAAAPTRSAKKFTISVASLIPGSTPEAIKQFNAQVVEFEKKYPTITVKPVEYQWTAPTFAAKLAAGTLPVVFEVPFTDARTLGDHGQLANLTPYFKKLPYHKKYNKAVLAEGTDAK